MIAVPPPMDQLVIRPIAAADRGAWEPLWQGYLDFYGKHVSRETTEVTWKRLTQTGEIRGLIAVGTNGEAFGIVHFLYHSATSTVGGNCYIPDLFVSPTARKKGVGRRLLEAVSNGARRDGLAVVYWQTEEFNGAARRLYERVAKRSPFIRYNIEL